ncbi:ankyrin [Obba rivulosa]|uniref:Ankyrin n=1 Tax=Obba rivulosa TaxID=1052685 RepID=A0A8E2DMK5_9APHY|nr:ankyrin [Obba rivulosa]
MFAMAEKDASARLRRAVKENNLFLVKRLIKRADMRNPEPSSKRYTSLAWAAVLGHEETFEFLLGSGHDDHEVSKDSDNNTILILLADARPAVITPYGPSDHDFLSATLRMARLYYDRYPEILDWANREGKTALHVAALKGNEELVRMLCDLGADFDLPDNDGNTPLHYASAWGHMTVVQLLIERGCQYSARNNEGFNPSDYAYSISTRDTLQEAARMQFENNKKARRNVFAQAAARGNDWASSSTPMLPPKAYGSSNGSMRMRSGSGTSRTTTTSDSGDLNDVTAGHSLRSQPSFTSSLSPGRYPPALPSASYSPALPSGSSTSSTTFSGTSPSPQPYATLAPNVNPASALSPIATRMRERDADAIEKYKLRQRSGSATTNSTDTQSQSGSGLPSAGLAPTKDDNIKSLNALVTVGSVAPRRRLRPSASAAQLRSNGQTPASPPNPGSLQQDTHRNRSGTSPANLKHPPSPLTSSPKAESISLSTPTQTSRPSVNRSGSSKDSSFTGPPSEYAKFPPPPVSEEPAERASTPTTSAPTSHSRRLPFNLLSSHKSGIDQHVSAGGHRRNASVNAAVR